MSSRVQSSLPYLRKGGGEVIKGELGERRESKEKKIDDDDGGDITIISNRSECRERVDKTEKEQKRIKAAQLRASPGDEKLARMLGCHER